MVPIHYFLALLAVLVSLMGCSQKAPPGSPQKLDTSNNTAVIVEPSPSPSASPAETQSVTVNADPTVVKPLLDDASGVIVLDSHQLLVTGKDAKNLYDLLEVKALGNVKTSNQIRCAYDGKYTCLLLLNVQSGELYSFNKPTAEDHAAPELVLPAYTDDDYFQLDKAVDGKDDSKTARMNIKADLGKKIFDALKKNDTKLADTDSYRDQVVRKGVNVSCIRSVSKSDSSTAHTCTFWFNYNTGLFDLIQ